MTDATSGKSTARRLALPLAIGALAGFSLAFGFTRLIEDGAQWDMTKSQGIGAQVGLAYVLIGMFVLLGVLMPKAGARL